MTDWQQCDANRPKCSACTSSRKECKYTTDPDETRFAALKRTHIDLENDLQELRSSHHDLQQFVEALKFLDDNAVADIVQQLRQGASIAELARDVCSGSLLLQLHGRPTLISQRTEVESRDSTVATPPEQAHAHPTALTQHRSQVVASPYEELFDLLRTASNQQALETLCRIRQGHDVHTTLRKAKEADPVAQLSLVPETRRQYNFPHRSCFPHFLKIADNPYLGSRLYKAVFKDPAPPQQMQVQASNNQSIVNQALYTTPFHAAKMVDPYLWSIKASKWTCVTNDDQLVSELLNTYFLHQYTIYMGFHKDYFLKYLAKGRTQFCSSLLVNTLLAAACHASMRILDRAKFWSPQNLAYQFLAEARRLWEIQDGKSSLTAIQAAIVLNIIYDCDTMDKIGRSYLLQAVAMAHDLKLFQSSSDKAMSKKTQRARAFTAWCLYAWDAMHSFHYRLPPLFDEAPEFPLPSVHEDPSWYPEIYVRYPLDNTVITTGFSHVIKAMVELQQITHNISCHYWGGFNRSPNNPSAFRRQLDDWFCNLPEPLTFSNIILPMHLRIHLEYHSILVSLIQVQRNSMPIASSDHPTGFTKRDYDEIGRPYVHIETLIRLYYLHHNIEVFDPYLVIHLLMLGNYVIEMLNKPAVPADDADLYRSTLILCARGLHAQGKNSYIATMVYLMLRDRMETRDNALLKTYIHDELGYDQDSITKYNQSNYPVGTDFAVEDNGTWCLAPRIGSSQFADLYYIKIRNTGTNMVEAHAVSAQSEFKARLIDTGTGFNLEDNGTWLMTNHLGDPQRAPDLTYIKTRATGTNKIEVHINEARMVPDSRAG
ncbi:hypothetical protein NW760_014979 [Fusarium oxysporum]|nr:hypothetical protein NW760_014979 [Fusarium oxysporum]